MGTYINLTVLPNNISISEWEQIYEESLVLLKAYPYADIEERDFLGYKVQTYVKATEKINSERFWSVRGDLNSMRYAEIFKLSRDISKYQTSKIENSEDDILFEVNLKKTKDIFNSKTQGFDYHLYILSIAMLIESRLGNRALVGGDIDYDQCVKAKRWADQFLSSPIEIPARVDYEKLLSRFSHSTNEFQQIQFIEKWFIADEEEFFQVIFNRFSRKTFIHWFSNKLKTFSSPNQSGALKMLIYFLNATTDLKNLVFICCKYEKGPKFSYSEIIKSIAHTWICLSPDKFSFLDLLAKNSGQPQIVERQLGTEVLEMLFSGRDIKAFIPLTEVVNILIDYIPDSANNIELSLRQEMSKIEDQLLSFNRQIQPSIELFNVSTEDRIYLADQDAFLYFDGYKIALTEKQELTLKAIAYSIKTLLDQEGKGDLKQFFFGPLEKLKLILAAFVNEKFHMILTEQAWQWINKTDNPLLIRILIVKVIIDDANGLQSVKTQDDIRKAMFENKFLTKTIANFMDDAIAMKEIARYATD
ncbi:hypothetical protein [Cytobacillus solani]|uniref:Uncharacterized protein n=1 Tax=Cytobacillus solani TaxID=1637975 RepID=A0A0Q3VH91_9BACI|nr:hypothetical protein [Cytobacillus solani]KQL19083.1 hypothetical protein AN957_11135 [Cytobacillus solani]